VQKAAHNAHVRARQFLVAGKTPPSHEGGSIGTSVALGTRPGSVHEGSSHVFWLPVLGRLDFIWELLCFKTAVQIHCLSVPPTPPPSAPHNIIYAFSAVLLESNGDPSMHNPQYPSKLCFVARIAATRWRAGSQGIPTTHLIPTNM